MCTHNVFFVENSADSVKKGSCQFLSKKCAQILVTG